MLITEAARKHAAQVIEEHWAPDKFPVDPVAIAFAMGIRVWEADLPAGTSGYIVKKAGQDAEIFLNIYQSAGRKTFTCAHEIGHYYERSQIPRPPDEEYSFVDLRDDTGMGSRHELYANEFAANLLMPAAQVEQLYDLGYSDVGMADYFGVSKPALTLRLQRLKLR